MIALLLAGGAAGTMLRPAIVLVAALAALVLDHLSTWSFS